MVENKEYIAYCQMTRQQQKDYIAMLVRSTRAHQDNAGLDEKEGRNLSALCHRKNAISNLQSLKSLLSEVLYNDVIGDL